MSMSKPDSCAWIRDSYGVPAREGMHVTWQKKPGVIKRGTNYVSVLFAGQKNPVNLHPTDADLIYLNDDGSQAYPQE